MRDSVPYGQGINENLSIIHVRRIKNVLIVNKTFLNKNNHILLIVTTILLDSSRLASLRQPELRLHLSYGCHCQWSYIEQYK